MAWRIVFAIAILALSTSILAQDAPAPPAPQRIEVTGSNIRRIDIETASPVTVITREEIERTGLQTISDVIRSIPQNNNGSINNAFQGFAQGASAVSLRGLGVNSTLVLLNGRRMATYALTDDGQRSFVDLDTFPLDAVERVEILRDSGSAIYGSDAIAGVVNVILRRDYVGGQANVNAGGTTRGGGSGQRGTLAYGAGQPGRDPYNAFFFIEAAHTAAIPASSRGGFLNADNLVPYGGTDNRSGWALADAAVALPSLVGNVQPRNADGSVIAGGPWYSSLAGCSAQNNPQISNPASGMTGCYWGPGTYTLITPQINRYSVFGRGTYDFSPSLQGFAEISWFRTDSAGVNPPQGINGPVFDASSATVGTFQPILPVGHPDNPFSAQGLAAAVRFAAASVPFDSTNTSKVFRALAGLTGDAFGWDFNTAAMFVRNDVSQGVHGLISKSGLTQGLNDGSFRIGENFALSTPAALALAYPSLTRTGDSWMSYADFRATRDLMQLAGGPLALAAGAELRHESEFLNGDFPERPGDILLPGFSGFDASRNVAAVYAELSAQVVKTLELSAALRWDHYSDYGNSTTPKIGFKWKPVEQFALRGTYAGGFRAPGPSENGHSNTVLFIPYVDPVRCPITGLPSDCGAGIAGLVATGDPGIQPETSKGGTLGIILQPTSRINITADYYLITRRNEITPPDMASILNDPLSMPNATIVRDAPSPDGPGLPGPLVAVTAPYFNATRTRTSGIDLQASARTEYTAYGQFGAAIDMTYILTYQRTLADGSTVDYVGTHGPLVSSNTGTPQTQATLTLNWNRGPWTVTSQIFYVSAIRNIANNEAPNCLNQNADGGPAPGADCRIPSFTTVNLYGKYALDNHWELNGAIGNLFNRDAPFDPQAYAHNYNYLHQAGAIGTTFNIGVKYAWK